MTPPPRRRVLVVYGTRPEAIKMAPLVGALARHPTLEPVVAVTGQHREMLDQVNDLFGIVPDHDLELLVPGAALGDFAGRALRATTGLVASVAPDAVVVQGDTSSAFVAALAAFYERVPAVHLEAGLRSGDLDSPFPEEANRRLLTTIARLHLAPTPSARRNLEREGVDPAAVAVTGNTCIDALHQALATPARFADPALARLVAEDRPFVLVTTHRRESWGEPMREAMAGLREAARALPELSWVLPMHRNPVVREVVDEVLGEVPGVHLTEPLPYHEFCHAMRASTLLLTDSGGVQEEAPALGRPVLVMRDNTERPEAVAAGTARLVGTDRAAVRDALVALVRDPREYDAMATAVNPYGDGRAAPRAVAALAALLGVGSRLPDFAPPEHHAAAEPAGAALPT